MLRIGQLILLLMIATTAQAESLDAPASETSLNTANVIRAA